MNYKVFYHKGNHPVKKCYFIDAFPEDVDKTAAEHSWIIDGIEEIDVAALREKKEVERAEFFKNLKIGERVGQASIGVSYDGGISFQIFNNLKITQNPKSFQYIGNALGTGRKIFKDIFGNLIYEDKVYPLLWKKGGR